MGERRRERFGGNSIRGTEMRIGEVGRKGKRRGAEVSETAKRGGETRERPFIALIEVERGE